MTSSRIKENKDGERYQRLSELVTAFLNSTVINVIEEQRWKSTPSQQRHPHQIFKTLFFSFRLRTYLSKSRFTYAFIYYSVCSQLSKIRIFFQKMSAKSLTSIRCRCRRCSRCRRCRRTIITLISICTTRFSVSVNAFILFLLVGRLFHLDLALLHACC